MYGADGLALSQPVKTKPVKSTRIYRKQRSKYIRTSSEKKCPV